MCSVVSLDSPLAGATYTINLPLSQNIVSPIVCATYGPLLSPRPRPLRLRMRMRAPIRSVCWLTSIRVLEGPLLSSASVFVTCRPALCYFAARNTSQNYAVLYAADLSGQVGVCVGCRTCCAVLHTCAVLCRAALGRCRLPCV